MSLYGHNETLYRQVGDWVEPGDVIAGAGDSGGRVAFLPDGSPIIPVKSPIRAATAWLSTSRFGAAGNPRTRIAGFRFASPRNSADSTAGTAVLWSILDQSK